MSEEIEVQEPIADDSLIIYENKALAKVDPLRKELDELLTTYKDFPDVSTTKGEAEARAQIKAFRDHKGKVEKERKDKVSKVNYLLGLLNERYNEVWDDAEAAQLERDKKLKDALAEKERIRREKDEAEQKVLIERTALLTSLGAGIIEGHMTLNGYAIKLDQIKNSPDQVFRDVVLKGFQDQAAILAEERAENERQEQERQEKLRQEQEEFRQEQDAFRKEQEEMKQQRYDLRMEKFATLGIDAISYLTPHVDIREMSNDDFKSFYDKAADEISERKEQERVAEEKRLKNAAEEKLWRGRLDQLQDIGWNGEYAFDKISEEFPVLTDTQLVSLTDEEFENIKCKYNSKIENRKEEAERERQEELERQRKRDKLISIGTMRRAALNLVDHDLNDASDLDLGGIDELKWKELFDTLKSAYDQKQHEKWLKEQEEQRELEELKEKERLADMSDGERWRSWKNELTKFTSEMPDFSTKRYGKMKAIALEKLSEIHLLKAAKISSN